MNKYYQILQDDILGPMVSIYDAETLRVMPISYWNQEDIVEKQNDEITDLWLSRKNTTHLQGKTDFSRAVEKIILGIPYGETKTYQQVAQEAGYPKASRAVANVCAKNEIAILFPCHRVVGAKSVSGYKWFGSNIKKKLILRESQNNSLHEC